MLRRLERLALRPLTAADALAQRWYGWRFNPLYQSGTIVVALYLVLLATGLWLLLFYRVGAPWESVAALTANPWTGNWVRGLHRYATDAAVVATAVHAVRMFAQGRSWGARTLAWVSGALLLILLLLCAWTGYVLVWDTFGAHLARESARAFDTLPILSEPLGRAFTGERPVPAVFFFITLFAHIGVPLGMAVVFWLHIKRLQRPALLPPRRVTWTVIALLTGAAVVGPLVMAPKANPFTHAAEIPTDLFVAFWLPLTQRLSGGAGLAILLAAAAALLAIPWLTARRGAAAPAPSRVDEDLCTGCLQCALDCPYGAITMMRRDLPGRSPLVARVDPDLCVSCGICAGSCAPMGVGPAGRTGRDQLAAVRAFLARPERLSGEIVAICCDHGVGAGAPAFAARGTVVYPITCAGNLHSSVVERLLCGGAGGVMVLACPPRDCWHREGPRWLTERLHHGREAELQPRVPRDRIRTVHAAAHEVALALSALDTFTAEVSTLTVPPDAADEDKEVVCDRLEPVVPG
jgi:ferredoxin